MSFWTGFTTGLAKSVDQGLQKAMTKREDEMSRAKTFWMTRQAQNLDDKEAYDKRAEKALGRLIRETGSSTLGLAAFNAAGGDADSAEDFLKEVDATRKQGLKYDIRANLQLPETYKVGDDIAESDAYSQVRQQMKGVDSSSIKVDDPLSKIGLGLKGGATEAVAQDINQMFTPTTAPDPVTGVPTGTFDRSGLITAKEYQQKEKERGRDDTRFEREGKLFDVDLDAKGLNIKRTKQAIKLADEAAALAGERFASEEAQRNLENARNKVKDLQTQSQLIQDAEAHVKNMESTDLSIEEKKLAIAKEKKFPAFKSYENMAVFASNALATGDFKEGYTEQDYKDLYNAGLEGVEKIANAKETEAAGGVSFSKPNRQTILNNEIKRTLQPVGLVEDIEGKITYKIEGNKPLFFESMTRALDNVSAQTKDLKDPMMDALVKSQKDSLKADIKAFKAAATPKTTTKQQASSSAFISTLKPGDVISYTNAQGKVITRLWTGRDYL
tara:strand:- start:1362 stop:2858 length:1497 start_codon:yes stop_codon:yes gene_type:complete